MTRLSDEDLLADLRARAEELGRTPKVREARNYGTYCAHFGSWRAALLAAGLEPLSPHQGAARQFTDEVLLEHLRRKAKELGRSPGVREVAADPSMPGHVIYFKRFGGHVRACRLAGLKTGPIPVPNGTYASSLDCHLQKTYGITEDDYWRMHAEQDGRCAICDSEETRVNNNSHQAQRLAVDHCHKTGTVRGLLCSRCNHTLGQIKDSPSLATGMASYLLVSGGT